MNQNLITIKKPKWRDGSEFYVTSYIDASGAVTPVHYATFRARARSMGWKMLSRKVTMTETTEIWQLPREQINHNEVS